MMSIVCALDRMTIYLRVHHTGTGNVLTLWILADGPVDLRGMTYAAEVKPEHSPLDFRGSDPIRIG